MTRISEIAQSKSSLGSNDVLILEDGSDNLITKKISGAALLASAASSAPVQSVAGKTGAVSLASGDIAGLSASATTDTTNASNISSGTLNAARLPSVNIGTTSVDLTRASGSLSLTGVSIDGNAGTVTNGIYTTGSYSDPSWLTISKSKVGLANVENTALSTWAGSTNITTLGTISTGTVPIANVSGGAPAANPTFTGVVTVPAGTAAAPSLTITGDPNTGIYSPGADQIALATGGTGRVFVDASGNVGIGQSSITAVFGRTVSATGTAAATYRVAGATTSAYLFTSDGLGYGGLYAETNNALALGTNSLERLRIDSSGNVGIGTSSPGSLLHIKSAVSSGGNVRFENTVRTYQAGITGATTGVYLLYDITNSQNVYSYLNTSGHIFYSQDTERLRIDSSGNVGIGTSSPAVLLDCFGTTTTQIRARMSGQADVRVIADTGIGRIGTYSNHDLLITTNSTERLRIDSSGRLLVGTSSARTVSAYGIPAIQNESTSHETSSLALISNSNTTASPALVIAKTRGTSNGSFTVVSSGDALGVIQFQGADGTQLLAGARIAAEVDGTPGANDMPGRLIFSTTADGANAPTERMRIKSTGAIRYVTAFTVATLPAGEVGDLARVTDASSPTIGNTVAGGGAAAALCWYNGSNWTVIGK